MSDIVLSVILLDLTQKKHVARGIAADIECCGGVVEHLECQCIESSGGRSCFDYQKRLWVFLVTIVSRKFLVGEFIGTEIQRRAAASEAGVGIAIEWKLTIYRIGHYLDRVEARERDVGIITQRGYGSIGNKLKGFFLQQ